MRGHAVLWSALCVRYGKVYNKCTMIVVKEADKGSVVVIHDREKYVQECMRYLNDNNHYQALDQDPTSAFFKNACRSLEKALEVGLNDHELKDALKPKNLKPGRFYTLPKLHKDFDTIPSARPIVSANGSVTEKPGNKIQTGNGHKLVNAPQLCLGYSPPTSAIIGSQNIMYM